MSKFEKKILMNADTRNVGELSLSYIWLYVTMMTILGFIGVFFYEVFSSKITLGADFLKVFFGVLLLGAFAVIFCNK
jgi:hypothetical protein